MRNESETTLVVSRRNIPEKPLFLIVYGTYAFKLANLFLRFWGDGKLQNKPQRKNHLRLQTLSMVCHLMIS